VAAIAAHRAARIHVVTALKAIIAVTIQVALMTARALARLTGFTKTGVTAGNEQKDRRKRPATETTKHIFHAARTLNCRTSP
jgi:hypothetical protein